MRTLAACCAGVLALAAAAAHAQEALDRLDDALSVSGWRDNARVRVSGLLDLEAYGFEHPAPGLIDATRHFLFNPRLTVFLDAQLGARFYLFAQARLDRGFDPGERGPRLGLDEYALRFTPWEDGRLNLQFGKAATVFGGWTGRHLSWENPFVNAPLPYENALGVSATERPASSHGFGRVSAAEKYEFVPVIWGPSYATGALVSGRLGRVEYAAEVKNAALASRPESWDATEVGFEHPAVAARLGFRPDVAWNLGFSVSEGTYLRPEAELPRGQGIGDYREIVLGQDVSYSVGRWQLWAECFESRFEIPEAGDLDAVSYYLEAKYKWNPQLFGALRWNQQVFGDGRGESSLSQDSFRIDAAVSYRFTAHVQLKLQYSFQGGDSRVGDGSTAVTQLTVRF